MKKHIYRESLEWKSAAAKRLLNLAGEVKNIKDAVKTVIANLLVDIPCPPTNLEAICPKLNIIGFFPKKSEHSGELEKTKEGLKIFYAPSQSLERRRFIIAHEIAHAIFENSGPNCPRHGKELERLCEMLGAEILMPFHIFEKHSEGDVSIDRVITLHNTFKTSISATAIRYAEIKNVFTFEEKNGYITRGCKFIPKNIPIKSLAEDLFEKIQSSTETPKGSCLIYLSNYVWTGTWGLEWMKLEFDKRTLLLLKPIFNQ